MSPLLAVAVVAADTTKIQGMMVLVLVVVVDMSRQRLV